MQLDHKNLELLNSRIYYEAEARRSSTLQRGFGVYQRKYNELEYHYRATYDRIERRTAMLQRDLELSQKLIEKQKELIACQSQDQQSASLPTANNPLLPSCNDQSYQQYHQYQYPPYEPYQQYQPPPKQEYNAEPRQLESYDRNAPVEACYNAPVATSLAPGQVLDLLPVSSEQEYYGDDGSVESKKRSGEEEGGKRNKKRKTRE